MQRSTDRILTTHTGSLPRPGELVPKLLAAARAGAGTDVPDELQQQIAEAVATAVRRQRDAGVDIVSDGEMGKVGFANYVLTRLTGFGGPELPFAPSDMLDYPALAYRLLAQADVPKPANDGTIGYVGQAELDRQIETFAAALGDTAPEEAFMTAISPGCVVQVMGGTHFSSRADYLAAVADALRHEYQAIVAAGFTLQIDAPDFAMGKHTEFIGASIDEFRDVLRGHVDALNDALSGIDPERVRVHACWGNYAGPHHHDIPLRDIVDLLYSVNANGLVIEAANPRHEHEWRVFEEFPLPEGKVLFPGVIDSKVNAIEHPELVAERVARFADVVGPENVVAATDCGFGTFTTDITGVDPEVAYAKLANLAEGARLASDRIAR